MSIYAKPFTQIFEDVMYEMREANFADPNIEKKYKRRVNDVYTRMIPNEHEFWDFLKKRGIIQILPALLTGTVTVTQGGTTVTHSVGGFVSDYYKGWKFTIPGQNEVYNITTNDANTFTLDQAYLGTSGSNNTFRVFKSVFELPNDFEYMTTEPGFWYEYIQSRKGLAWEDDRDWQRRYSTTPQLWPISIREYTEISSNGNYQVEIMPPQTTGRYINFEYFKALPELKEFTLGTATTTGTTSVTTSSDYSVFITPGMFFRIDSDGTWRRIVTVSGTTLTLDSAYPTSNATKAYTVCDAPIIPQYLHLAIFFGACMLTAQEQGGSVQDFAAEYKMVIAKAITKQNKKRYGRQVIRFSQHRNRRQLP